MFDDDEEEVVDPLEVFENEFFIGNVQGYFVESSTPTPTPPVPPIPEDIIEKLEEEIAAKQDIVQFIILDSTEGTVSDEELEYLADNLVNRVVYNNVIYYLSLTEGNIKKYFSKNSSDEYTLNEVLLNTSTGEYEIVSTLDKTIAQIQEELASHIKDTDVHIQSGERTYWNNKVKAEVVENEDDDDYNLILTNLDS